MGDQTLSAFPDEATEDPKPNAPPATAARPEIGISAFPQEGNDRLGASMSDAQKTAADTAASIFDLQLKTGLPHEVIARNLDEVKKQASAADFDPVGFRQKSPLLAKWLDSHPLNASVAGDDLVPLSNLEQAIRLGSNAIKRTGAGLIKGMNLGAWSALEMAGDVLGLPSVTAWAKEANNDAAAMALGIKGDQRAGVSANEEAFYSGFESIGSSAPILAISLATGNPELALTLMGTQTGGAAYTQARAAGVSIPGSIAFGTSQGAVEAATEMLPVHALFGDLVKHSGLARTLAHQALLEVPGEQLATALQDLNEWAVLHPGTPFQDYLSQRPSAAVQTLIATLVATGAQTGAVHTMNKVVQGMTAQRTVKDIGAAVTDSALGKRSPAKLQEFLESATKDTPLETVYAPVETWTAFWQSKGVDPAAMAEQAGSSHQAYAEAAETGADLAIPLASYATAIAGTEHNAFWENELRLNPGEMNAREAEAFIAAHDAALTSAATTSTEPTAPNVGTIHAAIVKQLVERGQMRQEDAETNAAVVSSMLENFIAKRAGLDPRTMFEARTSPGLVERVAGPEEIGTGAAVGSTASIDQTLFQSDISLLDTLSPETVAALDRRKATENKLPDDVPEERRDLPDYVPATDANAALKAQLEREVAGRSVGAGGAQQTLESLRRDPTLAERARAMSKKTSAELLAGEEKHGRTFNQGPVDGTRAEFLAHGPDGPLFNIIGGPKHGSTVGLKSLQDLGIPAPEVPADTGEKLNGDQIRAKMIAARTIPKPLFQSAAESENKIPAPIFFSRIVRAVEESQLAKAPGSQWVATIKNYKGGINKGEASMLNVDALASTATPLPLFPDLEKVYTKQEVLDHLAQNQLELDVVELSGESVDSSEIDREADRLRDADVESLADDLRQNYDEEEEKDAVRQNFDPPSYDIELHEADPDNEDSVDYYTATIDGEVQLDYSIPIGRLPNRSARPPLKFDTEEEAQTHVNERIQELEDEYVDENYSEPDFWDQARDDVDNNGEDYQQMARENLDGGGDNGDGGVHYEEYSVDGEHEDYAEIFLRVPELPAIALPAKAIAQLDANAEITLGDLTGDDGPTGYKILVNGEPWMKPDGEEPVTIWNPTDRAQALQDAKEQYQRAAAYRKGQQEITGSKPADKWVDGHQAYENIENPIVRIRLDTRESSAGKTLFLEEVQPPSKQNQKYMPELLLKNWRELAFKYAIRRAALEGHAAVAWATGAQQAQHYSLEKKVKQINWQKVDDKRRLIVVQPFDHGRIQITVDNEGQVLEASDPRLANQHVNDILGPEIFGKMTEPEGQLNPEDLKMGGYGLKRLYDKDFVNVVNGLASVKKAKGKVSTVTIVTAEGSTPPPRTRLAVGVTPRPDGVGVGYIGWTLVMNDGTHWGQFDDEAEARRNLEAWEKPIEFPEHTSEQNAILMTPELKAAALGGQPMFQSAPNEKRGAISFNDATGQATISLFAKADLSTFPHETAHLFLELVGDTVEVLKGLDPATLTEQQQGVITDYDQVLLPFLGVSNRAAIGTEQHERFADAWEDYLMKGESPSGELRPIFARMKAWLLGVYRQVQRTITLTPEVKGFMDRLLASEDAIVAAEEDAKFTPLFTTAESAQMTPEQFELYRKDVELAAATARERLDAQVRADVAKEQTRVYKAQKAAIRTAVEAELEQAPIYRALAAMRDGTHPNGDPLSEGPNEPLKLNRAQVVEILGENKTKTLPRPAIYTRDGGLDPAHVATLYGFSSAAELLEAIGTTPRLEDAINAETERRMVVAHGTLLTDGTLPAKAELAIANEGRDKIIRAEIRALQKLKKTVRPHVKLAEAAKQTQITALAGQVASLQKTARHGPGVIAAGIPNAKTIAEAARQRIAKAQIRTIHPTLFWAAARKANQAAIAAAAKQDFDAAIAAQTQQLLNLALYREAATVLEDVDRRVAAARTLDSVASRKRIGRAGSTYQDQIDGVLSRYEFAQVSEKTLARRAAMRKWAAGIEGEGFEVGLTDEQLDDARQVNYRELTYSELVGVSDGLKQIAHLAGLKNKLLAKVDAREFAEVRDDLVDSVRAHNLTHKLPLEFRPTDEASRRLAFAFASHRKIAMLARSLDGHQDGGAFWNAVIRPINAAADAKQDRSKKEVGAFSKLLETYFPGRELGKLHELLPIAAIQGSLSHEARLAVGLNWGTMEGRDRLLADPTRRWSQGQVEAILDTLSDNDWKFIRATWEFNERFWPEIAAQQERVTGVAPEKVPGLPVQTKFGTFPGGYYHLAYDGRLSPRAQQNEAATTAKLGAAAAYVRTTTKQGHVEARQQNVRLSVKLDLGVEFAHIEEVIHSLTHREMLSDVTRLLRDSHVQRAIYETAGDQVYRQFTNMLEDIAVGNKPADNLLDKSANFMRTGTQIAGLGWNLWTAAQQPLGIFNGMSRVGPTWVMRGMARWLRDASTLQSTTKWIAEVSPMMRNRLDTGTQDLTDLRQQLRQPGHWFDNLVRTVSADHLTQQAIIDGYLWHIGLMQRVADVPTWLGAYEKAMASSPNEPDAIARADQAVLDSQGGGQIKDLAQVQRGGPVAKLYMTFYSYGSTVLNASIDVAGATNYRSPASVAALLGHLSLLYIMPAMGTVAMAHAFGKAGGDDDDWTSWFWDVAKEAGSSALNGIVFLRELTGLFSDGTRGYEGPAGARFIQLLYKLGAQIKQGTLDEGLWKSANAVAGILFRYPSAQVQRTVDGFAALEEGRSTNPMVLLTGPPPKKAGQ